MKVLRHADLTDLNSLRFPSVVDELVVVNQTEDVRAAFDFDGPLTLLGEGSNVVLKPRIPGRLVKLNLRGMEAEKDRSGSWKVRSAAGENWHDLVRYTLGQGIGGLENLALIPGSVGAAPFQNIGAYGVELRERLHSVRVFDRVAQNFCDFGLEQCEFGYRDSLFRRDKSKALRSYRGVPASREY